MISLVRVPPAVLHITHGPHQLDVQANNCRVVNLGEYMNSLHESIIRKY